jgi:hypothetical protein
VSRIRTANWPRTPPAGYLVGLIAICGALALATRRPDAFTHAQFYAEDGTVWYAQAYNTGALHAFTTSQAGYLQTFPRLVAAVAVLLHLGLQWSPLLFNGVGLAVQIAPACFFASSRFDPLISGRWTRVAISTIYLLIPSAELHVDVTNTQWHLVLLAFLVVVAPPAQHRTTVILESLLVGVVSVSGPFGFILLPMMFWRVVRRKDQASIAILCTAGIFLALQAIAIAHSGPRSSADLGASAQNFIYIISNRVFLAGLFAEDARPYLLAQTFHHAALVADAVFVVGVAILCFASWKGPTLLRWLFYFAGTVLAASLISPLATLTGKQWPLLENPPAVERYFLFAELAWLCCIAWTISKLPRPSLRGALTAVACAPFVIGSVGGWRYAAFANLTPESYQAQVQHSSPGTHLEIPINPPGWGMDLTVR